MPRITRRIKLPKRKRLFNGYLRNDLEFVDKESLRNKIHDQSHFSILYLTLLISSVLVCTLGLLTDSSAIVIGGMLIAPLLWPLARTGYGIAHRNPKHLTRGLAMVGISIIVGAVSAYVITILSPIKVINDEILARTSPTLMDLFIALVAGLVAAISITQKKIADSLAGVAIAVSLMPPLCTVGIALGLRNFEYSIGALMLFSINAACITLVASFVFIWTQYARKERVKVATRAAAVNVLIILILAIPLVQYLRNYSFEIRSYESITSHMSDFIDTKDPAADFENITVEQQDAESLIVLADLLLPSNVAFTFEDNEALVSQLEAIVGKNILLNLRIQKIIEPISKDQVDDSNFIKSLSDSFSLKLQQIDSTYRIGSISITENEEANKWVINADVLSNPDAVPTSDTVQNISSELTEVYDTNIEVNATFLPRLTLRSTDQTAAAEAQQKIEQITSVIDSSAQVSGLVVNSESDESAVSYSVSTVSVDEFDNDYLETVKRELRQIFTTNVTVRVNLVEIQQISI